MCVKTRLFDKIDYFFDEAAKLGIDLFTLHGRQKGLKLGCYSGPSDFDGVLKAMHTLKQNHKVRFIVNGGVWNLEQHERLVQLGADGTMSATVIQLNPFIYGKESESPVMDSLI